MQSQRVHKFIPEAFQLINQKLVTTQDLLEKIEIAPETVSGKRNLLSVELGAICLNLQRYVCANSGICERNIANLTYNMACQFSDSIEKEAPDFMSTESHWILRRKIENTQGYGLPNFLEEAVFRQQILSEFLDEKIPTQCKVLIKRMTDMMKNVIKAEIYDREGIEKYHKLLDHLSVEVDHIILDASNRAWQFAEAIFNGERQQMFTLNPGYQRAIEEALERLQDLRRLAGANEQMMLEFEANGHVCKKHVQELVESKMFSTASIISDSFLQRFYKKHANEKSILSWTTVQLQISLQIYSDIVKKRLLDVVPMVVRSSVVFNVVNNFQALVLSAFDDETLEKIFDLDHKTRLEREDLKSSIERLQEAKQKLRGLVM